MSESVLQKSSHGRFEIALANQYWATIPKDQRAVHDEAFGHGFEMGFRAGLEYATRTLQTAQANMATRPPKLKIVRRRPNL
jgi:hypothetical protein